MAINSKMIGFAFAESLGVRTPQLRFCGGTLMDLPDTWPSDWGQNIVISISVNWKYFWSSFFFKALVLSRPF